MSLKPHAYLPLLILYTFLLFLLMEQVNLNVSDSAAPVGLYWMGGVASIKRGDLLVLRDPMKRLVGVPGDTVGWTPEGIYINHRLLPNSVVPEGSPYPHYPYQTITLAPDQYVLMGLQPLSWDARYLGPLPASLVRAIGEPLWTIRNETH